MIDPATADNIKKMPQWAELRAHIEEAVANLDRVSDINSSEADIATETLARKRALGILKDILKPFGVSTPVQSDKQSHTRKRVGFG